MSERLIDSVCPHCGRLRTTVRVVKHEDGFTKLSRLCKECGGEWIHTFDADWLAVAKMRRLEAEIERLRAENERLRNEADLTRKALGTWALVPPDGGADPTHERVAAVVAEVARMKKLHAPPADLPWPSREEAKP